MALACAAPASLEPWWAPHAPLPARTPTGSRFVTVRMAHGMNNQRQVLTMGALLALLLNRTLVVPRTFTPSVHNHAADSLVDGCYDLDALGALVPLVRTLPVELAADASATHKIRWRAGCCDITRADVELAASGARASAAPVVHVLTDYVYARPFWHEEVRASLAGVMRNGLRPAPAVWAHAARILAAAREALPAGAALHALHMRVGDRCPFPLLSCDGSRQLRTRSGERERMCEHIGGLQPPGAKHRALSQQLSGKGDGDAESAAGEAATERANERNSRAELRAARRAKRESRGRADGSLSSEAASGRTQHRSSARSWAQPQMDPSSLVSMLDAVMLDARDGVASAVASDSTAGGGMLRAGDGVYIATNQWRHKAVQRLSHALRAAGLHPLSWETLHARAVPIPEGLDAHGQSVVEQVVCAQADGRYWGAFPSSWDELVLHARSWLGRPGAAAELALFERKAREMFEFDRAARAMRNRTRQPRSSETSCHRCLPGGKLLIPAVPLGAWGGKPRRRRDADCPPIVARGAFQLAPTVSAVTSSASLAAPSRPAR